MSSIFARFAPRLKAAIVSRLGWSSLRPVQELAGAAILDGKPTVVLAPTAGATTGAAIFPILSAVTTDQPAAVGAIYLSPIKALLNNQAGRLGTYTEMVGLRRFVWHGDASQSARQRFAAEPCELLMTTPESLEVMLLSSWVPVARLFADLRFVIIDEVHALAGTDRGAHLISVLTRLAGFSDHPICNIGLSATVGNPQHILDWLSAGSPGSGVVVDPPHQPAKKLLSVRLRETVPDIANTAGRFARANKSLFFCQSRALAESVAERLRGLGSDVFVHHSA
ncbi:MAG: DEAD/DEAH box helicase, partial [Delftia sp.]|nr:DEAD/DEAH box helicase [Delftia sp.]